MNEQELLEEFVRVERSPGEVCILICTIAWEGPHTPTSEWVLGKVLPGDSSDEMLDQEALASLDDARFFDHCLECATRNPVGWMHAVGLCQSCASSKHGFVY